MATKSTTKRILVSLEKPLYKMLFTRAKQDCLSISAKARDLILRSLDIEEDEALESLVGQRMKEDSRMLSHDAFWKKAKENRKRGKIKSKKIL